MANSDGTARQCGSFRAFQRGSRVGQLTDRRAVRGAGRGRARCLPRRRAPWRSLRPRSLHRPSPRRVPSWASRFGRRADCLPRHPARPAAGPWEGRRIAGMPASETASAWTLAAKLGPTAARVGVAVPPPISGWPTGAFSRFGPLELGRGQQFPAAGCPRGSGDVDLRGSTHRRASAHGSSHGGRSQRIGVCSGDRATRGPATREHLAGRRGGSRRGIQTSQRGLVQRHRRNGGPAAEPVAASAATSG